MLSYVTFPSPLGTALAIADERALRSLGHYDGEAEAGDAARSLADARVDPRHPVLVELRRQLDQYFSGRRRRFDLPLAPDGSPFQRRVWAALLEIPWGETRSYGELARAVDRPGGSRAIGQANSRNPIGIVVPCHRVIAADGTLGGYTGGLERKRRLLLLEGLGL